VSKRDDMKAALEGREPTGAVPLWELEFHLWDEWSGEHLVLGREFGALTPAERERALHRNAEIIVQASEEIGYAAVDCPSGYWEVAPGQLAYYVLPGEWRWEQMRVLRAVAPPDLMLVAGVGGIISPPSGAGYEAFAYRLFDDPDGVEQSTRDSLAYSLELAARTRDLGIEVGVCAADIADNHGPYFTPAQMDRFILPYLHQWSEGLRAIGLYSVLHTDGMIDPILEGLAESGIDAVQAVDPIAGMDIIAAKRRVAGRLCLCGNIDCGLLHIGPAERISQVTRDTTLGCKSGGGFVLGASNAVFRETPLAHYRAMLEAWRQHGGYETSTD
jgi:uroporphyrinogen decarboxylase